MNDFLNHPTLVLVLSLPAFWFSGWLGARFRKKRVDLEESTRSDLTSVTSGALTLLGLIIGFTFSMAVSRYHQRKNYEVAETNAIGTEYARADFLPVTETARLRALLSSYLDQRILRYSTRGEKQVREVQARAAQLQTEMWSTVATSAAAPPVAVLVASGMNDVANSQRYAQALAEPNAHCCVGSSDHYLDLLQPPGRVRSTRATHIPPPSLAGRSFRFALSDCGH